MPGRIFPRCCCSPRASKGVPFLVRAGRFFVGPVGAQGLSNAMVSRINVFGPFRNWSKISLSRRTSSIKPSLAIEEEGATPGLHVVYLGRHAGRAYGPCETTTGDAGRNGSLEGHPQS